MFQDEPRLVPVSCPANTQQDVWEEVEVAAELRPVNQLSHMKTVIPPTDWPHWNQSRTFTHQLKMD